MTQINFRPPSTVWPFVLDHVEDWAQWDNLFTPEECAAIIELGKSAFLTDGVVSITNETRSSVRDSSVSWLYPNAETQWIFRRISDVVFTLNEQFFRFDLYGIVEGLQFTRYDAPTGCYKPHTDNYPGIPPRKLSVTIQLSDAGDYEGGELMFYYGTPVQAATEQGKAIVFPSYILHEVKPITKGTRYSLVCWITGAPFK